MALGVELAPVFREEAALCERGHVFASSAEVCEAIIVEQSLGGDVALGSDITWRAAAAQMDAFLLGRSLTVQVVHLESVWSTTALVSSNWVVL